MVFIRDEVNSKFIVLKPEDILHVPPYLRDTLNKYVKEFQLRWLLDEEDLAPEARNKSHLMEGTFNHYKAQKDDTEFDAKAAVDQSDSEEIADIWKSQDVVRFEPHEALRTKPGQDSADFLEFTEDTPEKTGTQTPVPEEGPDYLRSDVAPAELEDFGQSLMIDEDPLALEQSPLPDTAPVTMSQLQLNTKAQLWEMCDKLGIDNTGTKKEIIDRICKYWWHAHRQDRQGNEKS
jgi:hypothetical protein